jgi:hypothetical protein
LFDYFLDNDEHQVESAVVRLNLTVNEAYIYLPSITTATTSRHRSYSFSFFQKQITYYLFLGALNPYCEITVGSITLKTSFVKRTNRPKWNESMQFLLYNVTEDIIHINLFDHEFFSPDGMFHWSIIELKTNTLIYSRKYRIYIHASGRYFTMFT